MGCGLRARLRIFAGMVLAGLGMAMGAEDFSTWAHTARIRINTTATGANVVKNIVNFPLLIRLPKADPANPNVMSQSLSDGADIRFLDNDGTPLNFQMERWDPADGAEFWVMVPQIDGNSDKDYIDILWGKSGAPWLSDGAKVFLRSMSYEGVWHLGEPTTQTRNNSVGPFNHAVPKNYKGTERVKGVIGMADSLIGVANQAGAPPGGLPGGGFWGFPAPVLGSYLDVGSGFANMSRGLTFSVWAKPTNNGSYARFLDFGNGPSADNVVFSRQDTENILHYEVYNGSIGSNRMVVDKGFDENEWTMIGVTQNADNVCLYKNGVLLQTFKSTVILRDVIRSHNFLGHSHWVNDGDYTGILDEPEFSFMVHSADFMKLNYESQRPDGPMLTWTRAADTATVTVPENPPPPEPIADPAAGAYDGSVSVQLTCAADHAVIFYTLDGSEPDTLAGGSTAMAAGPIPILTNTVVKAKAYRAGIAGPVLTAAYFINATSGGGPGDMLYPGNSLNLDSTHTLIYPFQETRAPVRVTLGPAWDPAPPGFDRLGPLFTLAATDTLSAFPGLKVVGDTAGVQPGIQPGVQLYRREAEANHRLPANEGALWVPAAGAYFWGRDTLPPRIRFAGTDTHGADSLLAFFVLEDNVANLSCRLRVRNGGEDSLGWWFADQGEMLRFPIRLPASPNTPLEIQLAATDGRNSSGFPSGEGREYTVARRLAPVSAALELKPGNAWKLTGLPMDPESPLTLPQLASISGSGSLVGAYWKTRSGAEGDYVAFASDDALPAGKGFWIAANLATPNLVFPAARALASDTDGLFAISLRNGWNLVTCPAFRPLSWPVSPKDGEAYLRSSLKGLRGFDGSGYTYSDSLRPFEGYYVWYGGGDTVVHVGPGLRRATDPSVNMGAKMGAKTQAQPQAKPQAKIRLAFRGRDGAAGSPLPPGSAPSPVTDLEAGAAAFARGGLGNEDELQPPAPEDGASGRAWIARAGHALSTDYVPWEPDRVMAWTLIVHGVHGDHAAPGKPQGYRFDLESASLPEGYQAWAVSPARRVKYRLLPGGTLPVTGGDTLSVYAGTPEALAKVPDLIRGRETHELGAFDYSLRTLPGGLELAVNLPAAAIVDVRLWSPVGSETGGLRGLRLGPGRHVWSGSALSPGGFLSQGVHFLEIRVQSRDGSVRRVRKFGALR
jgi:hypothetical protein